MSQNVYFLILKAASTRVLPECATQYLNEKGIVLYCFWICHCECKLFSWCHGIDAIPAISAEMLMYCSDNPELNESIVATHEKALCNGAGAPTDALQARSSELAGKAEQLMNRVGASRAPLVSEVNGYLYKDICLFARSKIAWMFILRGV